MDDDDVSEEIEIIEYDDNVNIIDRIVIQILCNGSVT